MENSILSSIGYPVSNLEELQKFVPSAFSKTYHPDRTDRYSFVATDNLVNSLISLGWELHSGKQNGVSKFARHVIRFTNPKLGYMKLKNDNVKPQIILDNSHNGGSSAQLHMGLFRLVCTNGLVIAMPGLYTNVKFRHMGVKFEELKKLMEIVAEQYTVVGTHISEMQKVLMNAVQKEEFAIKAVAQREPHMFIQKDGTINTKKVHKITNIPEILSPIRGEDKADNLWSVFNVVQERMIKGGYNRISENGRQSKTRGITNATRNIAFNKELWEIAEEYI